MRELGVAGTLKRPRQENHLSPEQMFSVVWVEAEAAA